jgi:hypothetical protein
MPFGSERALENLVPNVVGVTEPSQAPGEGRIISSLVDVRTV